MGKLRRKKKWASGGDFVAELLYERGDDKIAKQISLLLIAKKQAVVRNKTSLLCRISDSYGCLRVLAGL